MKHLKHLKMVGIGFLVLILAISLAACGSKDKKVEQKDDVKKDGKIVLDYWNAVGGAAGDSLQELVDDFNNSQDKIKINSLFQGSYSEALNKLKQVERTKEAPSIVQLFGTGNREMIDTAEIVPVQKFMDEEDYDISKFEDSIIDYYTFDEKIYSMPFSTSNAIMYYNKDAFEEVGLDPEDPPHSYSEMEEAAKKLTIKDGSKIERYGFSFPIYGWLFEELMANQGELVVNNDNGRRGERATAAAFDSEAGLKIMSWLSDMHDKELNANYGRDLDDYGSAFKTGEVAITMQSSAHIADYVADSDFEVGTTSLPYPDGVDPKGAQIGGNSHWIMANQSEEAQEAAWEFLKFLSSAENQAFWSVNTGYFPIRRDARDEQVLKDAYKETPQLKTPVEQLDATKAIPETGGAAIGVIPEMRQVIEDQIERLYDGSATPEEALKDSADKVTKAIEKYNKITGN